METSSTAIIEEVSTFSYEASAPAPSANRAFRQSLFNGFACLLTFSFSFAIGFNVVAPILESVRSTIG